MVVTLIPPPSANRLWRTFRGRTVRTKSYTDWLAYAAEEIITWIRVGYLCPVEVEIVLTTGKGVASTADLDNFIKPLIDALTPEKKSKEGVPTKPGAGVIPSDSILTIVGITARVEKEGRGKTRPPALITLSVRPA